MGPGVFPETAAQELATSRCSFTGGQGEISTSSGVEASRVPFRPRRRGIHKLFSCAEPSKDFRPNHAGKSAQAKLRAQVSRHHVDEEQVSAVRIVENSFFEIYLACARLEPYLRRPP